jgi:hypothetical protein
MRPPRAGVMFGSRKPLNRSHNPGTLDAAPSGIDYTVGASSTWGLVQPPRGRSDAVLLGHETASPHAPPMASMAPSVTHIGGVQSGPA